ncbi:unnamed protein product [Cladocopium goreaui]|uniref:Uncharacterized protein n=1 Tax=Cladocopium goreaui TaxID=2562237 RepID=A0A9P1G6K8_9DINO|nr:unnamed protein product [Cladocopium goreaui]
MRVILLQLKENADESLQRAWKNGAAKVLQSALARMGCTCAIEVNEGKDGRWMAEVNSQTTGTILETHFNLGQVDEDGEEKQLEVNAKASAQDPSGAVDAGNGSRDVSMPPVEGDSKQLVHMFYVRLHVPKYMEGRDGARKVLNPHVPEGCRLLRCVALQNGGGVRADLLASRKDYDVFVKEVAKLGRVQQLETGDLNKEKEVRAETKRKAETLAHAAQFAERLFEAFGSGGKQSKRRQVVGHLSEAFATSVRVQASHLGSAQSSVMDNSSCGENEEEEVGK